MIHLALIALLGCGSKDPGHRPDSDSRPPTQTGTPGPADRLRDAAEAAGWTVQEGAFVFSTMEYCCDAAVTCLGNNPSTPYGLVAVPPGPDQTAVDVDTFWMWGPIDTPGLSRTFRLRPDEAVVLVGEAPPTSKYFSLRSSIGTRLDEETAQRDLILGSLGPTTNQLTLDAELGAPFWGQPLGIVTSADFAVEAQVEDWLVAAGLTAGQVHRDRIPMDDVRMGLEAQDDTFMIAARVAVADDLAAMEAYAASPPLRVLRLTPPTPMASQPMGRDPLPARGSGLDESAWEPSVQALETAITARFAQGTPWVPQVTAGFTETFDCIEDLTCIGDVRDRYAARIESILMPSDNLVAVVYGVNHERTGRTAYSNFAVMVNDNWVGADAIDSAQMVGSARPWLPNDPLVDDLYAWILARDCSAYTEPCLQIETECPWPDLDESFFVTWRLYLDPVTGAAPADDEILADRLVLFALP